MSERKFIGIIYTFGLRMTRPCIDLLCIHLRFFFVSMYIYLTTHRNSTWEKVLPKFFRSPSCSALKYKYEGNFWNSSRIFNIKTRNHATFLKIQPDYDFSAARATKVGREMLNVITLQFLNIFFSFEFFHAAIKTSFQNKTHLL